MATEIGANPVGRSASELAELVRTGKATAVQVVQAHLAKTAGSRAMSGPSSWFGSGQPWTKPEPSPAGRDLASLPLAGVPVTIRDSIAVARQLKELQPWRRFALIAGVEDG